MNNVEILKQGYQNFSTGNIDAVLAIYHPYIVWEEATGKKFRANAIHVWTLDNGKITHFFQASDTAEIILA